MSISPRSSTRSDQKRRPTIKRTTWLVASAALLLLLAVASICAGSVSISWTELVNVLAGQDSWSRSYQIISFVRLPRTFAAIMAGSALAVSGAVLQTVLNNPLASAGTIGVNAGAGLFTIVLAAFFPAWLQQLPLAAFLGALFAVLIVYTLASRTSASRITIVLAGIAVSSFLGAFTDTILTLVPDAQFSRIDFLIGSFSGVTMNSVRFAAVYILLGVITACILSYDLNILALGEETATSLGLRSGLYRLIFLLIAALLAGSAVSFSGLIGFVGLIVPNVIRMLTGNDNRLLIPLSALLGGAFTLGCDILARTLFSPFEIPVGIVMSFLGGPFFVYLLITGSRRRLLD